MAKALEGESAGAIFRVDIHEGPECFATRRYVVALDEKDAKRVVIEEGRDPVLIDRIAKVDNL